jgi:hypothetical protein
LAPTYHRAFDAGLIYLNEQHRMLLNNGQLHALERLNPDSRSRSGRPAIHPDDLGHDAKRTRSELAMRELPGASAAVTERKGVIVRL